MANLNNIQKIKIIIKSAYYFFRGGLQDFIYKKNFLKLNPLSKILELFFVRVFFSVASIRNIFLGNKKVAIIDKWIEQNTLFNHKIDFQDTFNTFSENGLSVIGKLNNSFLKQLTEELFPKIASFNNSDDFFKDLINKEKNSKGRIIIRPNNFNKNIKKLFESELIQKTTKYYLGTKDIIYSSNIFISFNYKSAMSADISSNALAYHSDCRYRKFFKVFIYLNDVDSSNGPHCFVKTTNRKKQDYFTSLRVYSDEEVSKYYKDEIVSIEGEAGHLFLEDTFGLHKGNILQKGYRAVLVLEIGVGKLRFHDNDIFKKKLSLNA